MRKSPSQDTGIVPQLLQLRVRIPDEEKPPAKGINNQTDQRESKRKGMKRSKRILQKGWME
jgi:hypothetical protein